MGLGMIEAARFTPPTFAEGLENWSSGDGVAGDPGYDLSSDASLVPGDSDFWRLPRAAQNDRSAKIAQLHTNPNTQRNLSQDKM